MIPPPNSVFQDRYSLRKRTEVGRTARGGDLYRMVVIVPESLENPAGLKRLPKGQALQLHRLMPSLSRLQTFIVGFRPMRER